MYNNLLFKEKRAISESVDDRAEIEVFLLKI